MANIDPPTDGNGAWKVPAHVPLPHPQLGRWVWKATCEHCGESFGGYENDNTDCMKGHYEHCERNPDNTDIDDYPYRERGEFFDDVL